jgi:hypothetical protein
VYTAGCPAAGWAVLLPRIASGISYWRANNFLDPNLWQNDFGAPVEIQKLLAIMANATTGAALASADAAYVIALLQRGSDPMWHSNQAARCAHRQRIARRGRLRQDVGQHGGLAAAWGLPHG